MGDEKEEQREKEEKERNEKKKKEEANRVEIGHLKEKEEQQQEHIHHLQAALQVSKDEKNVHVQSSKAWQTKCNEKENTLAELNVVHTKEVALRQKKDEEHETLLSAH